MEREGGGIGPLFPTPGSAPGHSNTCKENWLSCGPYGPTPRPQTALSSLHIYHKSHLSFNHIYTNIGSTAVYVYYNHCHTNRIYIPSWL